MQNLASAHINANAVCEKRILIVEDDKDIAELIRLHLSDQYATLQLVHDGQQAYELATEHSWDLIVLDLRLPGKDGLELCRDLRANQRYVPILILTSRSSELDRVLGLEMGADDYLTKPFSIIELSARIKAIFRRIDAMGQSIPEEVTHLSCGRHGIEMDSRTHLASKNAKELDLTAKEFDLLWYFLRSPGEVFSRAHLLDKVWGYGHEGYEHTVNSHINRLRAKIETHVTKPEIITTVWGVGYRLSVD